MESAGPTVAEKGSVQHTRLVSLHWPWVWGSQDFTADFRTETVEYDSAVLGQLTPADQADGPTKRSAAANFRVEAEAAQQQSSTGSQDTKPPNKL